MKLMYIELDEILNETFADTASREFLIRRCAERGISAEPATRAVRKGTFNIDVPIGSRFTLERLYFITTEKISDRNFKLICETPGSVGNFDSGTLLPVEYMAGLETALLTDVLIPGDDEETTEHLRSRYFRNFHSQAFGGNVADYIAKVSKLPGVGGCKVYPAWNGAGTVKVVIIDSQYHKPTDTLVEESQMAIDPDQNHGEGMGFAPIGHVVTVVPVDEAVIDVVLDVTYQTGWNWAAIKPHIEAVIDNYYSELSTQWAAGEALVVRISQIEARLLGLTGILDITGTMLNDAAQNIALGADCIPIRGELADV
jgi:uncharacterized phage protein gp47/JayE